MNISAVIINYNGVNLIEGTIDSLRSGEVVPVEIIVVDNGSSDNSVAFLEQKFPDITLIKLPKGKNSKSLETANYARHVGLVQATSPLVLVTDNDIIFHKHCLKNLYNHMSRSELIACCTPRLFYFSRPNIINMDGGIFHYIGSMVAVNRDLPLSEVTEKVPRKSSGCGINLLRRDVALKIGSYDCDYLLGWGDDVSLHIVLQLAGYECWQVPKATALHHARRLESDNPFRVKAQIFNRWRMFLTVYQRKTLLLSLPVLCIYEMCLIAFSLKIKAFKEYRKGFQLVFKSLPAFKEKRKSLQQLRKVSDRIFLNCGPIYTDSRLRKNKLLYTLFIAMNSFINLYWKVIEKWL